MSPDFSRRSLLQGASAFMAAGAAAQASAQPQDVEVRLGVASYSFREFSRHMCIDLTKQLGTRYLCIKEFHALYRSTPDELKKARAEFEKAGLTLTGGGTVYMQKDDDDDIRFYFDYARTLGLPLMNIGATAQSIVRIEKFVKEYDIKIAIHNHGPEDKHFPAPSDALKVIQGMDPRVGVCIDVGHTTRAGKDVLEEIKLAGPRLLDMHMKDLLDLLKPDSQCAVGEGAMPVPAIFRQLKAMRYPGTVHLEYEIDSENPLPGMQRSFAYMRGVLAGLAKT
jgi:sugar phosphate isomerase/epimerase